MNNTAYVGKQTLTPLDARLHGPIAEEFFNFIKKRAVGQPRMFEWLAGTLESVTQGFFPERGPAESVLFVGPSGVGKTYMMNLLAEFLFEDPKGFTRIDGQEMSREHNVARLTGAPPGYVGYGDEPMITQEKLDFPAYKYLLRYSLSKSETWVRREYHNIEMEYAAISRQLAGNINKKESGEIQIKTDALRNRMKAIGLPLYDTTKYRYLSLLLLDEIERAHPDFHNILFRVLDEGELSFSSRSQDNKTNMVSFRKTIIIATSNLGSEEVARMLRISDGRAVGYGFMNDVYAPNKLDVEIYKTCRNAVDNYFSAPFINRFGDVIAARPLFAKDMADILSIEIVKLCERLSDPSDLNFPIVPHFDQSVLDYLVSEASERPEKGIRLLQQKLNRRVIRALAALRSTSQIKKGDILHVSLDPFSKKLVFFKKNRFSVLEKMSASE